MPGLSDESPEIVGEKHARRPEERYLAGMYCRWCRKKVQLANDILVETLRSCTGRYLVFYSVVWASIIFFSPFVISDNLHNNHTTLANAQ